MKKKGFWKKGFWKRFWFEVLLTGTLVVGVGCGMYLCGYRDGYVAAGDDADAARKQQRKREGGQG